MTKGQARIRSEAYSDDDGRPAEVATLRPLPTASVGFVGKAGSIAIVYQCLVAWTIYETQGFHSIQEVLCVPDGDEVLMGSTF